MGIQGESTVKRTSAARDYAAGCSLIEDISQGSPTTNLRSLLALPRRVEGS